jgi:hypothetical protein
MLVVRGNMAFFVGVRTKDLVRRLLLHQWYLRTACCL